MRARLSTRARPPRRVTAYTHPAPAPACTCPDHPPGARFYVSVVEEPARGLASPMRLLAGPFPDHDEALRCVDPARRLVLDRYNPHGRAHWYGYGTTAMAATYETPGRLNSELGVTAGKEA